MKNPDEFFMTVANLVALQSTCVRVKVGAVIAKDNRIVSIGYNGTPPKYPNCCDVFKYSNTKNDNILSVPKDSSLVIIDPTYANLTHHEFSELYEVHAEMNAIIFAWKNEVNIVGSTIYSTTFPCMNCTKMIITSGIKKLVYQDKYDMEDQVLKIKFLNDNGVEVIQFKPTFELLKKLFQ